MTTAGQSIIDTPRRLEEDPARPWIQLLVWASILTAVVDVGAPALAGSVIPPLAVGAALTLVALVLLRRKPRAGVMMLGIVNLLLVVSSAPFSAPNLAHPESPLSFSHAAIHLLGRPLAVVAAVAAWRHVSASGARRVRIVTVALLAVIVVTGVGEVVFTSGPTPRRGDVVVVVQDFAFPDVVRVASGGDLLVENKQALRHTFTVTDTDMSQELPERRNVRFAVDLLPGTYQPHCSIPGHENMTATLVVE
jgi:plastocyanin